LEAVYGAKGEAAIRPATEAALIMHPFRRSRISGGQAHMDHSKRVEWQFLDRAYAFDPGVVHQDVDGCALGTNSGHGAGYGFIRVDVQSENGYAQFLILDGLTKRRRAGRLAYGGMTL
jgi:hypothetical protein